jgi:glutathione synthase
MRFVFVMDPVSTVKPDSDTSFVLMLEAAARGHRVDHCLVSDVFLDRSVARAFVRRATPKRDAAAPITLGEREDISLEDVDVVFIRKDPPFDAHYHWLTLLLERLRGKTIVINDPRGLREANEKIYACHFPELMPETLVCADKARIAEFVDDVGGKAVIKPVDGFGGHGVLSLMAGDPNFHGAIEMLTVGGTQVVMVQRYLPEISTGGDKRILLLDGEPLGVFARIPQGGDLRSNLRVGGRAEPRTLTAGDKKVIDTVAPRLKADGLYFVGLDVIGDRLTEVNVTSPTGIQTMSALAGKNLTVTVLEAVERRVNGG